jgi:hypothetical protein
MKKSVLDIVLLVSFLILDISKSAVLSWSHANKDASQRPPDFNVILTKDVLCMLSSVIFLTYAFPHHDLLLQLRINKNLFWIYLPIALIFVGSQNSAFAALQLVDIGTFKLLVQGTTPMTAILSTCILRKKYSIREIFAIVGVLLFAVLFSLAKNTLHASDALYTGCIYAGVFIILSSFGGVVSEKVLKTQTQFLSIQYFYSKIAAVVVSLVIAVFRTTSNDSFFTFFDYRTCLVILQYGISGFVVTAITRSLSSTSKNITQAASAAIAQILTIFSTDWMHTSAKTVASSNSNPAVILCAIGIIACVILFHSSAAKETVYDPIQQDDIELELAVRKNHLI